MSGGRQAPAASLAHVGICVSDLDRSLRFYCEALGFVALDAHDVGDAFARLMELEHVELRSQFLRGPSGERLELLAFRAPAVDGEGRRRPLNRLGLTHLCFRVRDVDEVAERIQRLGGEVHDHTRTSLGGPGRAPDFVYCSDPDGIRIELMRLD
jgi:catechol 2,3-dioxygenase-like lactoylglutathione lyase family enzyme